MLNLVTLTQNSFTESSLDRFDLQTREQCGQIWQISPFWYNLKSLGQIFDGLFSTWRKFDPTVSKRFTIGQVFIVVDGQIVLNNLAIWSHCLRVTLLITQISKTTYLILRISIMKYESSLAVIKPDFRLQQMAILPERIFENIKKKNLIPSSIAKS